MAKHSNFAGCSGIRVVVVGDRGTGKSSQIAAMASESFPEAVPPTLLPDYLYPEGVPITIIDTSSSLEKQSKRNEELNRADEVVLTYACAHDLHSFEFLLVWELKKLEVKEPVIVAGCKLDLRDENQQVSLERVMTQLLQQFRNIFTCIECSAVTRYQAKMMLNHQVH